MDKPVKLDVLAIAAHPDDIEITCGGLLIKMAKMGRQTGALDLTRGEMGTHGTEKGEVDFCSMEMAGDSPSMWSTSGFSIIDRNWRA